MRTWTVLALVACGDGGGGDGVNNKTERFDELINVEVEASADLTGFTPGDDVETTQWLTQTVDPALQGGEYDILGLVEDFESGSGVDKAEVALWLANSFSPTADVTAESDSVGDVAVRGPSCEPVLYRVTTDPVLGETKTTFKPNQIYPHPGEAAAIDGAYFTSVSSITYQLIPTILGVVIDPDLAIIAGTAFDITRDPSWPSDDPAGKIEGAQIIVYDADGNIPDTLAVNYFVSDFPDRDQKYTSPDGLWVASNVPPGDLRVEMWGRVDGELKLLGATELFSETDSINIANVYAGYRDGVKFPASCEQ
ncbi:MAG: hypothetical protein ACI9K2_002443 [Myxococcota bacterium]|jgi:hypothetical protein